MIPPQACAQPELGLFLLCERVDELGSGLPPDGEAHARAVRALEREAELEPQSCLQEQ